MKCDNLNLFTTCRSGAKTALLAILVAGCTGTPSLKANDSRTVHVVLDQLATSLASQEAQQLKDFSARSYVLFADFFDMQNNLSYKTHKAHFETFAKELKAYLSSIKGSFSPKAYKEAELLAKQLYAFIMTLDKHAQPILKKGANATNADIVPLAMPLKDFSFLIPDAFIKNLPTFLNAIRFRLSC